jgi:hypothetical protein
MLHVLLLLLLLPVELFFSRQLLLHVPLQELLLPRALAGLLLLLAGSELLGCPLLLHFPHGVLCLHGLIDL